MRTIQRRQFIKIGGLLAAGAALAGCNPANLLPTYPQLGDWPTAAPDADWRLLNRITFGPRPAERARIADIGPEAFIEEQLAPDTLPEIDFRPGLTLRRLETLDLDAADLFDVDETAVKRELQQATLLRAVYSHRQLHELMVDFWSNHFNIDQNKGDCAWLKTVDDRDVIRPHALGNFHDLLSASAHSPAMLIYLDNQENHAANPNENYARELLELHTVSIDSDYTQRDVQELARCLTGWTVKKHFYRGEFTFDADQHDDGPKQIMGFSIPGGIKKRGGEQVIEMLATHPSTARFIATKLARRFVDDQPSPKLVAKTTQTFLDTQGDIKATLRTILLSSEMLTPKLDSTDSNLNPSLSLNLKLKRPFEYVASALRQLNAQTNAGSSLLAHLTQMGQPLFQWPTPDGYPDRAEFWSGSLLARWRFALALANNRISGTTIDLPALLEASQAQTPVEQLNRFATLLLGNPLPDDMVQELLASQENKRIVLAALLGSPGFQWR